MYNKFMPNYLKETTDGIIFSVKLVPNSSFSKIVDFVLPNRCLSCGKIINTNGALCQECFSKITFIGTEAEFNSINVNATNPLFLAAQVVYG